VRLPDDYEQPRPAALAILFDPDPAGIYDIEWIIPPDTSVASGEPLVRGYRISDGLCFTQTAAFPLNVTERLVKRNHKAVAGDSLLRCELPSISIELGAVQDMIRSAQLEMFQAVNAAFKGLMGYFGEGGQIVKELIPVEHELHPENGVDALTREIVASLAAHDVKNGDVVVVSEKLIAIAQGRLFPLELLYANDPKTTDRDGRADLLKEVAQYVPDVVDSDLLLADALAEWPEGPMATCGVRDANTVAFVISQAIKEQLGSVCDVVISDTDTGAEIREQVIGCTTIGATPLGATGGLVLYECMRVACAAEFARGSSRGIPIVVCRPHERHRERTGLGRERYPGMLDARRERLIGFA
jgi:F420-0:gamma-glutamyl ligase